MERSIQVLLFLVAIILAIFAAITFGMWMKNYAAGVWMLMVCLLAIKLAKEGR